jgi:hypothetical protein
VLKRKLELILLFIAGFLEGENFFTKGQRFLVVFFEKFGGGDF